MKIKVDPTGHFNRDNTTERQKHDMRRKLVEATGIVPFFVDAAYQKLDTEDPTPWELYGAIMDEYQFYLGPMEGGTIDAEGVYRYPEDPDMYPMVSWLFDNDTKVYMYQYAIVAVVGSGETLVTRMD